MSSCCGSENSLPLSHFLSPWVRFASNILLEASWQAQLSISRNIWEFRGRRRSEKSEGEWNRGCRLFEWKSLYCFQIEYPKNRWKNRVPLVFVESACSATFIRSKPAELDVPCTELCKTVHLPRKTTNATSDRGEVMGSIDLPFHEGSAGRRLRAHLPLIFARTNRFRVNEACKQTSSTFDRPKFFHFE